MATKHEFLNNVTKRKRNYRNGLFRTENANVSIHEHIQKSYADCRHEWKTDVNNILTSQREQKVKSDIRGGRLVWPHFCLFILQNKFYNRPSQAPSAKPLTSKDLQKDTKTYGNIHLNDQTTLQFYFCFRIPKKKKNWSKLWMSTVYLQFSVKALLLALLDSSLSHDLRA